MLVQIDVDTTSVESAVAKFTKVAGLFRFSFLSNFVQQSKQVRVRLYAVCFSLTLRKTFNIYI